MRSVLLFIFYGLVLAQFGAVYAEGDALDVTEIQGRWVLESIEGRAIDSQDPIYFKIDGMVITGYDRCNRFGGRLDSPGELRVTQRACVDEGPRLPLDLRDPWSQLSRAALVGDMLMLPIADGSGKAVFRRK